jgi:peptidyl-prolyl isomerase G (cyclophilin G)
MAKKKNPLVFMDVSIDGDPVERMVFEVHYVVSIYAQFFYYAT